MANYWVIKESENFRILERNAYLTTTAKRVPVKVSDTIFY